MATLKKKNVKASMPHKKNVATSVQHFQYRMHVDIKEYRLFKYIDVSVCYFILIQL